MTLQRILWQTMLLKCYCNWLPGASGVPHPSMLQRWRKCLHIDPDFQRTTDCLPAAIRYKLTCMAVMERKPDWVCSLLTLLSQGNSCWECLCVQTEPPLSSLWSQETHKCQAPSLPTANWLRSQSLSWQLEKSGG